VENIIQVSNKPEGSSSLIFFSDAVQVESFTIGVMCAANLDQMSHSFATWDFILKYMVQL
jgi:hypothetical protein